MNNGNADGLVFKSTNPFSDIKFVETLWTELQARSVHSYFNSWGWVSTWLLSLPADIKIAFHVGYQNQTAVVAFFLGESGARKYGFLPSKTLALNASAHTYYDSLYIEYNTILYDASAHINFDEILNYLLNLNWDELILPGVSNKFVNDFRLLEQRAKPFYLLINQDAISLLVDLEKIRTNNMDFMRLLSSNRRSQLRRSLREYETTGKIHIQEANSVEEALNLFDKLVLHHQTEWNKKGWPGVFSNPYFYKFHKDLIAKRYAKDEIQLLRIYTDQMEIGYIYSFISDGDVLFYQSGFKYHEHNNYRPGLVSHYLAILHNAKKGMKTYDFLAGDSSYKRTLATDSKPMYWLRLYKSKRRYIFEEKILRLKSIIKSNSFLFALSKKASSFFNT